MKHSRRQFLINTGSLVTLSSLSLSAQSLEKLEKSSALGKVEGVVAYRESNHSSSIFASVMAEAGMTLLPLALDPVKQWREQVSDVLQNNSVPMLGLTDWADFQMMRDLNAEQQRRQVVESMHNAERHQSVDSVVTHALDTLESLSGNSLVSGRTGNDVTIESNARLFSWMIS